MGNLFNDEDWEIESRFLSVYNNAIGKEIENAKNVYHNLKKFGYITSPSELCIDCIWLGEKQYFTPRKEEFDLGGYTHLTLVEHPNGMCSYAAYGQYLGSNLFQRLYKEYAESRQAAISKAREALLQWCERANVPQEWVRSIKDNFERISQKAKPMQTKG